MRRCAVSAYDGSPDYRDDTWPDPDVGAVVVRPQPPGPVTVRLSDVEPERVAWLWLGRLPRGKLVTLDGDPGVGKSTLALDWAARISTGSPWPDRDRPPVGAVLILSAEDGIADTIRPRIDAAGGDAARVHVLTEVRENTEDGMVRARPVTLADVEQIEAAIRRARAALVVVDVLMAYLPGRVDSHRDQDVRGVLHRVAAMAERTGCCILLLRHLSKSHGASAIYAGGGSIGIIGAARVGLVVGIDPDDDTGQRRVLAIAKVNIAAEAPSLAYRLAPVEEFGCARIEWHGESAHTAARLVAHHADGEDERTERDEAADWLRGYLIDHGGEAPAKDVFKAARADGIAERTLKRARDRAGVTSERRGFGTGSVWSLNPLGPHSGRSGQHSDPGPNGTNGGPNGAAVIPLRGCPKHPGTPTTTDGKCPLCVLDNITGGAS
jgi:hypothetical protein